MKKKTYLFGFGRYYIQLPFHMLISDRSIEIRWSNDKIKEKKAKNDNWVTFYIL